MFQSGGFDISDSVVLNSWLGLVGGGSVVVCDLEDEVADQIGNSFGIYSELKLMPRDIVSKFCFLLGKCGYQANN